MSNHWKKFPAIFTAPSIGAVRQAVAALRTVGLKFENAIVVLAGELRMTRRRIRSLFYEDGAPMVGPGEWEHIRKRVAIVLRREAKELRRRASEWEDQADALDGAQLNLWDREGSEWQMSNASRRDAFVSRPR
jgi:hypothetical protein